MALRARPRHVLLLLLLLAAPAHAAVVPTLAAGGLQPGQRAIVHTVFRGDSIEPFDAEIVGVLHGGRAEGDLIIARALTERVVHDGVAAGMSGSPVYVDGKLIGALSSGWSFSRDPLFGITPIAEMLDVLRFPDTPQAGLSAGPTGIERPAPRSSLSYGPFRWRGADEDPIAPELGEREPRAVGAMSGLRPLPIPLACGGLSAGTSALVGAEFERLGFMLAPGGGGQASAARRAPQELVPGSACAVDLLRGDLLFSAIGTVTYRDGDRVLIFGHPFFQSGEVRLPLSTARITTIVASTQSSFKIGSSEHPVGAVTQDRRAAVAGRIGAAPELLPLRVTVRGASPATQHFGFESVEDRSLAPLLIATAASSSVLESGGSGVNQTLRWSATLHRAGVPPLTLSDVAAGDNPQAEYLTGMLAPIRFLYNNPFARLDLDSVTVQVDVEAVRSQWTLRGARTLDAAVRPGGTLRVEAELERWRGGRETRTLDIPIPEELPDGRYTLWLGGGAELSRYEAGKLPGRYRPTSLEDAWERFRSLRPSNALYATLYAQAPEVTLDGRDYPELPLSALSLLASSQTVGDRTRRGDLAVLSEQRLAMTGAVRGEGVIQIVVDSKAP